MSVMYIIFWIYLKIVSLFYIPLIILSSWKKPKSVSSITDELLLLSASELAEQIRQRKITSAKVVAAYIKRIKEVNPIINAVIEERFNEALQEANNVEKILNNSDEEELKTNKPLLGVPITIKGSIAVQGLTHSAGRVERKIIPKKDAKIVGYVREVGAIPLLTSNVPELCLSWETTNKLIGTTNNPYNVHRTVGGSSGGEVSLLASGASVIGLGSDIAGSLRLPAHYCGVFGHKPSAKIVSCDGHYPDCKNRGPWQEVFTLGPLARTAPDLRMLLDIIVEPDYRAELNLKNRIDISDIKCYYMEDAGSLLTDRTNPEVLACLRETIKYLDSKCAAKCCKIDCPIMKYSGEISFKKLLDLDDVENLFKGKGEGSYEELLLYLKGESKSELYAILYGVLRKNMNLLPKSFCQKLDEDLVQLREYFLNKLKTDSVFICPTYPTEAHYHGEMYKRLFNAGNMSVFNSLGFPATHCPITFTKNGLPIGVQIVASPNCDNLTISVAEELEKKFGGWKPKFFY